MSNALVLFTQPQYSDMFEGMMFQYGNNCMSQKKICKSVDRAEGDELLTMCCETEIRWQNSKHFDLMFS